MSQEAPASPQATPPASSETTGLFPTLQKTTPEAPTPVAEPEWFVMDGMPGQGNRPEYLDAKYKSIADQAKGYKELAKKLGQASTAPDKYDLSKYEGVLNQEDSNLQQVLAFAREKHLSQDVVSGFMDAFATHVNSQKIDYVAEIAKLGENGKQKIDIVSKWAQNNLSDKAIDTINRIGHTADVIEFLDELRQYQRHSETIAPPPVEGGPTGFVPYSQAQYESDMRDPKYMTDPAYRANIKAKLAMLYDEG